jgi:hypothetical protein
MLMEPEYLRQMDDSYITNFMGWCNVEKNQKIKKNQCSSFAINVSPVALS